MPTLGQIMRKEIGEDRFRTTGVFSLREERVTAMRLATGVERWYMLESGRAVGVAGADGDAPRLHLFESGPRDGQSV